MSYRKWLAVLVAVVMILTLFPALGFAAGHENDCDECEPYFETILYAGQDEVVGTVTVTNDDEQICVTYALDEDALEAGWLIYETHLYIGDCEFEGVLTPYNERAGGPYFANPIPGQFPYGDDELGGVEEWTFCISFDDLEFGICNEVCIAAHAVIERVECETLAEAPYGGSSVVDSDQGLRYDYTPVRAQRSNPDAPLTFTTGQNEANFFSLGFQEDRDGEDYDDYRDNAWIIIEFDYPILNGPGDDLRVIEDTWGLPYPDETADVWVSQDGTNWVYLGEADNQSPFMNYHTITDFDLKDVGLDYAKFVKVQDTSNRADFAHLVPAQSDTLDGFDLNAVVALQDHKVCEEFDETAWGDGERFNERGNWGMYFKYKICEPTEIVRFPVDGTAYIGYEDRLTGSDFDYNDFGMNMELEETYVNGVLESISMKFTAVVNDAGDVHDIHIARALLGDYSYTVERSRTAIGNEVAAGDFTGEDDFDLVLFDTANFPGITGQNLNDSVKITITMAEGNDENLLENYEEADRFDLSDVFSLYEPYMLNRSQNNEIRLDSFDTFKDVEVPLILVVPVTDWEAPGEGQPIDEVYPKFLNYYGTDGAEDADWYLHKTNNN